jgi:ABC-type sugar transport system ATPase subunit
MSTPSPSSNGDPDASGLVVRGASKSYGHIRALSDVDFDARGGEIVALVGDNGAGKSTLVKIIAGVVRPDHGTVEVAGVPVDLNHPREALDAGIATVFQDLALVEALDVARNMFLGREPSRFGVVQRKRLLREATIAYQSLGIKLPPAKTNVGLLSGGQRQGVALARTVLQGGKVVLLDEPTAALGVRETAQVVEIIKRLRDQGKAVVLVCHDLELVLAVSDRVHVLRLGRTAGVLQTKGTDRNAVVSHITGGGLLAGSAGAR